jgi:hypothetical protein
VHAEGCDWLLLSGRPSRQPSVRDMVLAKLPVPPHRIVHMDSYTVGAWYPFRDPLGRISDPKTSAVVGAMLATLAEGRIEGFMLRASRLSMRSTARYLGRMEISGRIPRQNVLVGELDLDSKKGARELTLQLPFQALTYLGFRQLPLERWVTTPLYTIEFRYHEHVPNLALPLTITLMREEIEADQLDREERREDFVIAEIVDAAGDPVPLDEVRLRLRTMKEELYWRDAGILTVI